MFQGIQEMFNDFEKRRFVTNNTNMSRGRWKDLGHSNKKINENTSKQSFYIFQERFFLKNSYKKQNFLKIVTVNKNF